MAKSPRLLRGKDYHRGRIAEDQGQTGLRKHWSSVRTDFGAVRQLGQCVLMRVRRRVQLVAPYKEECIPVWQAMGGKWRGKSTVWSFPIEVEPKLRAVLATFYGSEWEWKR